MPLAVDKTNIDKMFSAKIIGDQGSLKICIKQTLYAFENSDKTTHIPQKHSHKVFQEMKISLTELLIWGQNMGVSLEKKIRWLISTPQMPAG